MPDGYDYIMFAQPIHARLWLYEFKITLAQINFSVHHLQLVS